MSGKLFAPVVLNTIYVGAMVSALALPSLAQQAPAMEIMVPLPDPNPLRSLSHTPDKPKKIPHPRKVETPDWSDEEISMGASECAMMLAGTGAVYKMLDPIREGRCGAPAPVELSSIGALTPVKIHPPAKVTCGLAATLSAWMDFFVQPAARQHLDARVTQIRNVASYVCRNRYGSAGKPLSEHARANALDMAAFQIDSGQWITVLDHWALPPEEQAPKQDQAPKQEQASEITQPVVSPLIENPKSREITKPDAEAETSAEGIENTKISSEAIFLNEIHTGGCTLFGTVLGPRANEAHKNHYHYDLAERKLSAYCE
jgi:hypothetical protein